MPAQQEAAVRAAGPAILRLHAPGDVERDRCARDGTLWPCDVEVLRWWANLELVEPLGRLVAAAEHTHAEERVTAALCGELEPARQAHQRARPALEEVDRG